VVLQHSLVDKACAAGPCVFWQGIGHHGHIGEVGHGFHLRFHPVAHVQIGGTAAAPIQSSGSRDVLVLHVLEQGFDRCKARTRGQQNHGRLRVFTQVETAVGAFDSQNVFFLHGAEHHIGKLAPWHVANVQFHFGRSRVQRVGCVGHAVASARTVTQQKFHILTRMEFHEVGGGQLHEDRHHVIRLFLKADHAHRHFLNGEAAFFSHLARLEHQITLRSRATGQDQALRFLLGTQGFGLVLTVHHRARNLFAFARTTRAIFAAIGQANALPNAGGQQCFAVVCAKSTAAGLYGNLEAHVFGILEGSEILQPLILPSNQTPLGALPARFRKERVLIIGCGDVGQRAAKQWVGRARVAALTSSPQKAPALRQQGIVPLVGNLDFPDSLQRLAGWATRVLHLAPPPSDRVGGWATDPRTLNLVRALKKRSLPISLVYGSTSGVYGDCEGAWVSETQAVQPHTPRAIRRVDAERIIRYLGQTGVRSSILRIPGIYAADRPNGTPRERLMKGTPVLVKKDDVFTNHIHADDLARACVAAIWRGKPQRVVHVSDDTHLKMGDYFDMAADLMGLRRPPRVARTQAQETLPLMLLSFMSESRRLNNERLKTELKIRLQYPTVKEGLQSLAIKTAADNLKLFE
jgi:nucleoside-diphosphate-sugar epimerase